MLVQVPGLLQAKEEEEDMEEEDMVEAVEEDMVEAVEEDMVEDMVEDMANKLQQHSNSLHHHHHPHSLPLQQLQVSGYLLQDFPL